MAIRAEVERKWIWTGATVLGATTILISTLIWTQFIKLPAPGSVPSMWESAQESAADLGPVEGPPVPQQLSMNVKPPSGEAAHAVSRPGHAETTTASSGHAADVPHAAKQVALTFDDGPDTKFTPEILDILKKYQVKATFFVVGTQVSKHPDMLKRILDEGHAIGNHSMTHANFTKLSTERIDREIEETDKLIRQATGTTTPLFRAPYGAAPDILKKHLKALDRPLIGWTVDTRDWSGLSPADMMGIIRKQIKPGGIILMHSFGGKKGDLSNTVTALPQAIEYLKAQGYSLVTVPELAGP
ncbi:polysaccharide deacetylase family protein [Paenibacillus filicis]|uniref:Polysaccharide deacetylase family protein n=1 Tax=Paenibacillus filicis TaxID=669464 RepID=A0ABU9DQ08_9BACL